MARLARSGEKAWSDSARRAVVFEHVSHSGGATVTDILRRNFPLVLWGEVENPWHFLPLIPEDATEVVVSNGFCRGLHADLPPDFDAFCLTMLRNPWRRIVSAFNYSRMTGSHDCDLEEFLWDRVTPNELVNAFGGGDLEKAKHRLENEFSGFGICERFDESLELFGRIIPLADKSYVVVARSNSRKVVPGRAAESLFVRRNALDMEFYAFAADLFARRLREAGLEGAPSHELPDDTLNHAGLGRDKNPLPAACRNPPPARSGPEALCGDRADCAELIETLAECDPEKAEAVFLAYLDRFGFGLRFTLTRLAQCLKSDMALKALETEMERLAPHGRYGEQAEIVSHKVGCLLSMADIAQARDDEEAKERHLLRALEIAPTNFLALEALADHLRRARRHEEACALCREKAGMFFMARRAAFLGRLGDNLLDRGDTTGALDAFAGALEADPLCVKPLVGYGVALRMAGRLAEAAEHFRREGRRPELSWNRGVFLREEAHTLRQMGDKNGAMRVVAEIRGLPRRTDRRTPPRNEAKLSALAVPGADILVIRTAPLLLLECLLERLGPDAARNLSILTPPLPEPHGLPETAGILPMPPGRYVHDDHAPALDPSLWTRRRDAVILLLSDEALDSAPEVARLARAIPARRLVLYTFRQVFTPGEADLCLEVAPQ